MSEGPEWFAPKRYGYGAGLPISWQGWALTAAFLAYAGAVSIAFKDRLIITLALMVPATVAFLTIVARTTRGGWRWRWGQED
jgi:hypothetical protein